MAFPKIDGYVVTEKLGSGSYSTVYKAYTKVGARMTVAVKCVDKSRIKNSGAAVDNLITEIRLLKKLTHPHIVHMHNFTWDDRNIYIIMEYCCGGDLSKYIRRYGRVPETQVRYFLQQLASALKFLREKGVVHMDLKPHNLLLHKDSAGKYILKVADFGFAQHMSAEWTQSSVRGSPLYMAPEMIAGDYGPSVDLWSVGVIMYECLFGRAPYSSNTFKELVEKIQRKAPIEIPANSCVSPGCVDLLTRLLQHEPSNRISYEEFFRHDYLDLEYMPSRDNYEKAVVLIKQAIDLDSRGLVEAALHAYTGSLRRLVPCACAERDPVRRAALTDKLTRYMERAEEIKQYLKEGNSKHSVNTTTQSNTNYGQSTSIQRDQSLSNEIDRQEDIGTVELVQENQNPAEGPHASERSPAAPNIRSRFGLKRFFGRQNSLPFLESKDSSITSESDDKAQKITSENNDTCRIT